MRPRCCRSTSRNIRPDALTDQISAHDLVNGYLPEGWSVERWWAVRNGGVDA
jgi:urocanate hydratase